MRHADHLIARTLLLEGHPNMQTLGPLYIGALVPDMVANDLHTEIEARNLYADAALPLAISRRHQGQRGRPLEHSAKS
jgi:bacterioferritin (cytochrome b1)